jgi:hypothetical protein
MFHPEWMIKTNVLFLPTFDPSGIYQHLIPMGFRTTAILSLKVTVAASNLTAIGN